MERRNSLRLRAVAMDAVRRAAASWQVKGRARALSCGVALLLSPQLGSATEIDASSFRCLTKMTPVRQFYVDNLRGNLAGTLGAAKSAPDSIYPPGSLVQLIPGEAMVKRDSGFNAQTRDWEFFSLAPSKDGTRIQARGTLEVANPFGTCLGCHAQASPQWNLVCETGHGCPPLPVKPEVIGALQRTDPRCGNPTSAEDAQILKQLSEMLKPKK